MHTAGWAWQPGMLAYEYHLFLFIVFLYGLRVLIFCSLASLYIL